MDRLRASTVVPARYQAARKCYAKKATSVPLSEHDAEGLAQMRIKQMPLLVLTDAYLATVPESDEALAALDALIAAAK